MPDNKQSQMWDIIQAVSGVYCALFGTLAYYFPRTVPASTEAPISAPQGVGMNPLLVVGLVALGLSVAVPAIVKLLKHNRTRGAAKLSDAEWASYLKTEVIAQTFNRQSIAVDGKSFLRCQFDNVTLVYNCSAPWNLIGNKFSGTTVLRSDFLGGMALAALLMELQNIAQKSDGNMKVELRA